MMGRLVVLLRLLLLLALLLLMRVLLVRRIHAELLALLKGIRNLTRRMSVATDAAAASSSEERHRLRAVVRRAKRRGRVRTVLLRMHHGLSEARTKAARERAARRGVKGVRRRRCGRVRHRRHEIGARIRIGAVGRGRDANRASTRARAEARAGVHG